MHRPDKYIQTAEQGMVIMGVTEQEAGRYDCRLGADTLCSYNITVDTQRCAAPSKSHDYQKVYSDWCHEFEKYKMAMKTWERRQLVRKWGEKNKQTKTKTKILKLQFIRKCEMSIFLSG